VNKNTIILFDLDGTLIDSTEAILESFRVAFDKFGLPVPDDNSIKKLVGLPLDMMFIKLGIRSEQVGAYVQAYKAHYRTIHTAKTTLLPGAKEAIRTAHEFAYLGVVTTKTAQFSKELLEHFGLMKLFEILVGREDVTNPKPDPEPIYKALGGLPKVAGYAYMIGDTCTDMDAARAAQINSIGVLCGYGDSQTLQQCADKTTQSASEAVNTILKEIKS
jgi:phosphoglycolate phosphatase